jgi:hypothetical protein
MFRSYEGIIVYRLRCIGQISQIMYILDHWEGATLQCPGSTRSPMSILGIFSTLHLMNACLSMHYDQYARILQVWSTSLSSSVASQRSCTMCLR